MFLKPGVVLLQFVCRKLLQNFSPGDYESTAHNYLYLV